MLLESMAGKAGAVHGVSQDATAFRFHEHQHASDYFGEQLRTAGYSYHGTDKRSSNLTLTLTLTLSLTLTLTLTLTPSRRGSQRPSTQLRCSRWAHPNPKP